ncbi:MAG TPA: SPOR domain-containing protein [Alphaproteobacteria bacterium]|nr:SPOR domain-containing protein [Alphaproteobacteria bacterium]
MPDRDRRGHQRCAALLGTALALLAGCTTTAPPPAPDASAPSESATDEPATAPPPAYHLGDSFTYRENGRDDTLVVTSVEGGLVTWMDDWGATWVTTNDPSQPPRSEITKPGSAPVMRYFSADDAMLFPLAPGKKVAYAVTIEQGNRKTPAVEQRSCAVGGRRRLTVAAGTFDTWQILCRHDAYQDRFDYAPAIGAFVLARRESFLSVARTELVAYRKAQPVAPLAPVTLVPPPPEQAAAIPPAEPPSRAEVPARSEGSRQAARPAGKTASLDSTLRQPASPPPGASSYAVQLAAYPSYFEATRGWEALRDRLPELLHGFGPRVEDIEDAQGTQHIRLFIGPFADEAAARRFCAALRARQQDCWVRAMR